MSADRDAPDTGLAQPVAALFARAASAEARAVRRLAALATELGRADDMRLDDEARAAIRAALDRMVAAIKQDLRLYADRLLDTPLPVVPDLIDRLIAAGLLDDATLVEELVARAWGEIIAERLPGGEGSDDPERPSLLPRLAGAPDRVVASAASALMVAEGRRRGQGADAGRHDLPAELHHRLVWWVAAGLRPINDAAADHALADAARRALGAHDEGARLEAVADRLAAALDCTRDELPDVLEEALADRRLALFVALIAHALGLPAVTIRGIVLDPDPSRLWLAMRALDLPRGCVARCGLALAEADRRRDAVAFAESVDTIMAISADAARAALAPLRLPAAYRAAMRAMEGTR
ncbi:MAG: DUF2336 domain-containing protein [Sphingomonas sp.]